MTTSTQLRTHARTADARDAANAGAPAVTISYADLANIDRLAAQLLDDDAVGDLTLAAWPEAAALVELARRLQDS